ncbi:hypothetical protein PTKIN_Ptkin12aG0151600 [Pterospermum kingtungense]
MDLKELGMWPKNVRHKEVLTTQPRLGTLDIQYSNPDGTPIFCNNKIGEAEAKIESNKVQIEANNEEDAPDLESDARAFIEAKYGVMAIGMVNEVDNKVTENLKHSLVIQELDSHMEIFLNKSLSQAFSIFSLPNLPSLDGCIKDVDEINTCDIGMRALGSIPLKANQKAVSDKHVSVRIARTLIHDCGWLYADSDGILISLGNNLKSSRLLHNGCQGYIMPYVYGYFPNSKIVNLSVSYAFYHNYEKGKKEALQLESNDVAILTMFCLMCVTIALKDEADLINVCKVASVAIRTESQFKLEKVILWVTKLVIFQGGRSDTSVGDLACGLSKMDLKELGMWPKNVGCEEVLATQPRLGAMRPRRAKRALSYHADYVMHSIIIIYIIVKLLLIYYLIG